MNKKDKELLYEIKHIDDNFEREWKKQQKERDAFLNDPANKEAVLKAKASMELSKKIYNLRKRAHLTQTQLAGRLHIKQPTYAKIENGQNLTINKIYEIAEACGADVNISFPLRHA